MKPGYRTTEFWATIIAIIVPILQAFGIHVTASPLLAQSIAGVATVTYAVQRAVLKHQVTALTLATTSTVVHKFVGEVAMTDPQLAKDSNGAYLATLAPTWAPIPTPVPDPATVVEAPEVSAD